MLHRLPSTKHGFAHEQHLRRPCLIINGTVKPGYEEGADDSYDVK